MTRASREVAETMCKGRAGLWCLVSIAVAAACGDDVGPVDAAPPRPDAVVADAATPDASAADATHADATEADATVDATADATVDAASPVVITSVAIADGFTQLRQGTR